MGTTVLNNASELTPIQRYVSRAAKLDAVYDPGTLTFTHNVSFDGEWAAAVLALAAGDPVLPGDMSIAEFQAAVLAVPGVGGGSAPRPLFAIWAEENGGLANSTYEWSWGNGATGTDIGIPLPVACELIAVSFNADVPGTSLTMLTERNGSTAYTSNHVGQNSVDTLGTPEIYAAGDVVAFRTGTLVGTWTDARVCAWFREL